MFIHVEVSGGASEVVSAFTALSEDAVERGLRVFVEDPVALAQGHGRFEVQLPNVDEEGDGRAAVNALIDQAPGGSGLFTIIDRD